MGKSKYQRLRHGLRYGDHHEEWQREDQRHIMDRLFGRGPEVE